MEQSKIDDCPIVYTLSITVDFPFAFNIHESNRGFLFAKVQLGEWNSLKKKALQNTTQE